MSVFTQRVVQLYRQEWDFFGNQTINTDGNTAENAQG